MAVYTFSWIWFFVGLIILALGGTITLFYNKFAEVLGVMNYSKWRIAGLILCGVGIFVMLNLHSYFITLLVQSVVSGL